MITDMKTYRKIFIYVLLLAYFNYMVGCYTVDEISVEENLYNEKINGVILSNGEVIEFVKESGKYGIAEVVIEGKTIYSEDVFISLDNVREIRGIRTPAVPLTELGEKKITEIVNTANLLIKFNEEGGKYLYSDSLIIGTSEQGYLLKIKINYIKEVHTVQPDTISKDELLQNGNLKVYQLITKKSNEVITFDDNGAKYRKNVEIFSGYTEDGRQVDIDASEVLYVNVETFNAILTSLTIISIVLGIVLIVVAVKFGSRSSSGGCSGSQSYEPGCNTYDY